MEYYDPFLDHLCMDGILEEENTTASLDNTRNLDVTIAPHNEKKGGASLVCAPPPTMAGEGKKQQGEHSEQ